MPRRDSTDSSAPLADDTVVSDTGSNSPTRQDVPQDASSASPDASDGEAPQPPAVDPAVAASKHHLEGQPYISLQRYIAIHRQAPDQLAGFAHHARTSLGRAHTVAEWDAHYAAFNQKPVR